jgi:hypothetical protein
MSDETKPRLEIVQSDLDQEEQEFRALRRDVPGARGAGDVGILTVILRVLERSRAGPERCDGSCVLQRPRQ